MYIVEYSYIVVYDNKYIKSPSNLGPMSSTVTKFYCGSSNNCIAIYTIKCK